MKKFALLFIILCTLLLCACTALGNDADILEETESTQQTERVETVPTEPEPTRRIVGYTREGEPVYEGQDYVPDPFYFDDYGARYVLEEGTIDKYSIDEEYREIVETPDSTAFAVISYWHFRAELWVQFRSSGDWYVYYDFEPETWTRFKQAESKGSFFNEFIKGQYDYEKE